MSSTARVGTPAASIAGASGSDKASAGSLQPLRRLPASAARGCRAVSPSLSMHHMYLFSRRWRYSLAGTSPATNARMSSATGALLHKDIHARCGSDSIHQERLIETQTNTTALAVHAAALTATIVAIRLQPAHADSLPQRIEDIALTTAIRAPPSTATEICDKVAKWILAELQAAADEPARLADP